MLTLRQSPFDLIRGDLLESDLFKKLEQQLHSAETQKAERVPAAEVHETPAALISEIRYGTWSRSFRFPSGINRDGLEAHYRDGVLSVTAPKAQTMTTVQVQVES